MNVIPSDSDFDKYKVLLLPVMIVHKKEVQDKVRKFVSGGGTVVFTYRTAVKDYYNNLTLGQFNPTYYTDLVGGYVEEVESFQDDQGAFLIGNEEFEGINGTATVFRDMLKTTTAKTLFKYEDEFFEDLAAVTLNEYEGGKVYYIGSGADNTIMDAITNKIINESNLDAIESEEGVEVVRRSLNNEDYYFVMNHTSDEKKFRNEILKAYEAKIVKA